LAEAQSILAAAAEVAPEMLPPEAAAIIKECNRLPLALALCGGMVQGGSSWQNVLIALREHDLEFLSSEHPAEVQHQNAWKAMDISLRVLPANEQQRFAELAVFSTDTGAPDTAVATLWAHTSGLSARHTEALLGKLVRRSLVQRPLTATGKTEARVDLHDLLHHFASGLAIKRLGSIKGLYEKLIEAYRKKCPNGWHSGPNDGYFLEYLCRNLRNAGKTKEAVTLLSDLQWPEVKCQAGLVFDLQNDYRETIAALPERQAALKRHCKREELVSNWMREPCQYAREWSDRRDRLSHGEISTKLEPTLPQPVPICKIWSEDRIKAACYRQTNAPGQYERLDAFARFVTTNVFPLLEYGKRKGFVQQHAYNAEPAGPVHHAAALLVTQPSCKHLLRRWSPNERATFISPILRTLNGHADAVTCVNITADGMRAISSSEDGTLRVWDLETGGCLAVLDGHTDAIHSVSITPDGGLAVSVSEDKTSRVWDLTNQKCVKSIRGINARCVSMTPDGRLAITGGVGIVCLWDLRSGTCILKLKRPYSITESICITPDGRRAVSVENLLDSDPCLHVWDLNTGESIRVLKGHTKLIKSVSITPDLKTIVSGGLDDVLRVWDMNTGSCSHSLIGHTSGIGAVNIAPDGRRAVSADLINADNSIRIWDLEKAACIRHFRGLTVAAVKSVALTVDGRSVLAGDAENTVRLWNVESGTDVWGPMRHKDTVMSVNVTDDNRRIVSGSWDTKIRVWELKSGRCQRNIDAQTNIFAVTTTMDCRHIISGGYDKKIRIWNINNGHCLRVIKGHTGFVTGVTVTPDGKRIISESLDYTLRIWN